MVNDNKDKFIQWRDEDEVINEALISIEQGAKNNMFNYRSEKDLLEQHVERVFQGDYSVNSATEKTNILRGHIVRTTMEIAMQAIKPPVADIEPVTRSKHGYESKTKASMTKAYLEWFNRVAGYESVFNEGLLELTGYGDMNIRPFLRKTKKEGVFFPALEDTKSYNTLIDPNATYITSESKSKQTQFYAHTQQYPEANLINRFGSWILDYAESGSMIDDRRVQNEKPGTEELNYYEVIELQNKAMGVELILVGSNAFPILRRANEPMEVPKDLVGKVTWSGEYIYKDSFGENIITLGNLYYYYDPHRPYNMGLAHKLAPVQVMEEINLNLQSDNIIKRLDATPYVIGADDRTDLALDEYRARKRHDRHAYWKIRASLNKASKPEVGVLEFKGLPVEEAELLGRNLNGVSKNMTGINPQRQEVQKDTGVRQTLVVEEKEIESIEAIMEKNIPNIISLYKMFVYFGIAHEGFGLKDVELTYTKYVDDTPDENGEPTTFAEGIEATISIPNLIKKIKDFEFDVIIDKSSMIRRSRASEQEVIIKALQFMNPQTDPEGFITLRNRLFQSFGIDAPEVDLQSIQQSTPQGGLSQFQEQPSALAQQTEKVLGDNA